MSSLSKLINIFIATSLFLASALTFAEVQNCVDSEKIKQVKIGYTTHDYYALNGMGNDNGNSITFTTNAGVEYPMNIIMNANDENGREAVKMLQSALINGLKISAWDHHGPTMCDDIDEITIQLPY